MTRRHLAAGVAAMALALLVLAPPLGPWLQQTMTRHMLAQYPALVLVGVLGARALPWPVHRRLRPFNPAGGPALFAALVLLSAAMVPRVLDAAVTSTSANVCKALLLVGTGLCGALGWRPAGTAGQAFVIGNGVWMLAAGGLVLRDAPVRLCASYLEGDQARAGLGLVCLSVMVGAAWLMRVVRPRQRSSCISTSTTSRFQLATSSPPTFSTVAPQRPPASIHG